mmetsp:Transcript_25911/g.102168  ORF Transcript_25911/g.102168 Transcript_25911/m.102168 type:complete len:324 (-) Transcript_25911:1092-2063(-)
MAGFVAGIQILKGGGGIGGVTGVCKRERKAVLLRAEEEKRRGVEPDLGDVIPFAKKNDSRPENAEKVKELMEMLDSPEARIRLRAVVATKDLSNEESEPILCKVFDDGEKELNNLYFATLALGYKPNSRSFDLLMTLLDSEVEQEIRANALAALGYLNDPRAIPTLIRAVYEETHWTAKCAAVVSLGILKDPTAYDAILHALSMDSKGLDDMKISAVGALGEIGRQRISIQCDRETRSHMYLSTSPTMVPSRFLHLGDERCLEHITGFAESDNFILRQILAESLANFTAPKALATLRILKQDPHPNVSKAAGYSLDHITKAQA